jgi:ribonuclease G
MGNDKRIIVNVECNEVRVATLEGNNLREFYVERQEEERYVGNIYKGRVDSVVPGIQSAFVDIGLEKNGFLYVTDVLAPQDEEYLSNVEDDFDLESFKSSRKPPLPIEQMLAEGDEIIVQVEKGPIGTKGVRLTNFVSLPGQFTVLMPQVSHRGVSRRISSFEERERLREIMEGARFLKNFGCIVRTAAEGRDKRQIIADFRYLTKTWNLVLRGMKKKEASSILHAEADLIVRTVREAMIEDINEFVIDNKEAHKKILSFVAPMMKDAKKKILYYKNSEPILEFYDIEKQVKKLCSRTVSLPCGGYLVIDETEALVAIDVNTGRNVGRGDFEKTVFKTNSEAAIEIPRQLRLRDIGGIVIIDFIDMKHRKNQQDVWNTLLREVRKEKNKINISPISKIGLVEMTRQRRGSGLYNMLHEKCIHCDGRGYVKTVVSSSLDVIRMLRMIFLRTEEVHLVIGVHPDVAKSLLSKYRDYIMEIERKFKKRVDIRKEWDYKREEYRFFSGSTKKEIELW